MYTYGSLNVSVLLSDKKMKSAMYEAIHIDLQQLEALEELQFFNISSHTYMWELSKMPSQKLSLNKLM